ncbi:response regulator [Gallaecimonas mangrovi]|uniref:response regulator n=1 Tax=Gallaecimonas mangrovi TaxID=2291597 RepID=UPI000E205E31|nr:response regulator [Gallaecimonas mangrovi]
MNKTNFHIIVVDDDPEISRLVSKMLGHEGYSVTTVADANALTIAMAKQPASMLVLDLMLPGENGLSICRRLRRMDEQLPILMLTAKSDEIDKVVGLEMGADDYLVKPFSPRELLARVRALLRRAGLAKASLTSQQSRIAFDAFVLNLATRELTTNDGQNIDLTSGEFELLNCFVQQSRRVLSRDMILNRLKGMDAAPFDRSVDMLVSRLRRKLADAAPDNKLITTVRNSGYLFTAQVESL